MRGHGNLSAESIVHTGARRSVIAQPDSDEQPLTCTSHCHLHRRPAPARSIELPARRAAPDNGRLAMPSRRDEQRALRRSAPQSTAGPRRRCALGPTAGRSLLLSIRVRRRSTAGGRVVEADKLTWCLCATVVRSLGGQPPSRWPGLAGERRHLPCPARSGARLVTTLAAGLSTRSRLHRDACKSLRRQFRLDTHWLHQHAGFISRGCFGPPQAVGLTVATTLHFPARSLEQRRRAQKSKGRVCAPGR